MNCVQDYANLIGVCCTGKIGIDLLGVLLIEGDKAVEEILMGCSDRRPSCYS